MKNKKKPNGIRLSPKYGLNPTIPVCFWCGKEKNEIALMGKIGDGRKGDDFEAPKYAVLDYEPCEKCQGLMSSGFTIMEVTDKPNKRTAVEMCKGAYPTGRFSVIKNETAERIFGKDISQRGKAFMSDADYSEMFKEMIEKENKNDKSKQ